jgi:hypothetical protein
MKGTSRELENICVIEQATRNKAHKQGKKVLSPAPFGLRLSTHAQHREQCGTLRYLMERVHRG